MKTCFELQKHMNIYNNFSADSMCNLAANSLATPRRRRRGHLARRGPFQSRLSFDVCDSEPETTSQGVEMIHTDARSRSCW
jgi:hypothetical protein